MKSMQKLASVLLVAITAGCASVDMNTEGGQSTAANHEDFTAVLAENSQGK